MFVCLINVPTSVYVCKQFSLSVCISLNEVYRASIQNFILRFVKKKKRMHMCTKKHLDFKIEENNTLDFHLFVLEISIPDAWCASSSGFCWLAPRGDHDGHMMEICMSSTLVSCADSWLLVFSWIATPSSQSSTSWRSQSSTRSWLV